MGSACSNANNLLPLKSPSSNNSSYNAANQGKANGSSDVHPLFVSKSLSNALATLSTLFTSVHVKSKPASSGSFTSMKTKYICGCLLRTNFKGLGFVLSDGENVWGKEVDLNYLQSIKDAIQDGESLSWDALFHSLKKGFQEGRISIDMHEDDSVCHMHIELTQLPSHVAQKTTMRSKLKLWTDDESKHTILSQYFLVPLYEYYAVRTETMPRQRIEELQKQLDLYKSELAYLEQSEKKKQSTSVTETKQSPKPQKKNASANNMNLSGFLENGEIRSKAQVAKFLSLIKKRLIQGNLVNEQEHEALTAVINNLNQDTIYRYELNKNNSSEKRVDMEVMAWLKNKFEPEKPEKHLRPRRDLATVDANSFIKNIDVSQIDKTKTRQDIIGMFEKVNDWNFDVFKLRDLTDGQTLFITSYTLFVKYDLLRKFSIPEDVLISFLAEIQGGYHTNPYHNSMHAADVLQVFHFIVAKGGLGDYLSDEDILAGMTSAIIHDYDHPGLNNAFQINTQSYLATLYNDRAVLENHHCAQAFELMRTKDFNIFQNLSRDQHSEVRETMIDMVLATDMGQHSKIVGKFKNLLENGSTFSSKNDVRVALEIAIKIADVSNPIRPRKLYLKWAQRISEEFYNQGDKERDLGLEISPFMDRTKPSLSNLQIAFIAYLVIPMIQSYCLFLPKMEFCRSFLDNNRSYWSSHNVVNVEDTRGEDEV